MPTRVHTSSRLRRVTISSISVCDSVCSLISAVAVDSVDLCASGISVATVGELSPKSVQSFGPVTSSATTISCKCRLPCSLHYPLLGCPIWLRSLAKRFAGSCVCWSHLNDDLTARLSVGRSPINAPIVFSLFQRFPFFACTCTRIRRSEAGERGCFSCPPPLA